MWYIEVKKAENVNIVDPIARYCKANYKPHQCDEIRKCLEEANNLRSHFCSLKNDISESVLTALRRYLFICQMLSTKIPFGGHKGTVNIKFKWTDTWKRQDKYVAGGISFEKACVLYNIGAIHANGAFQKSVIPAERKPALHGFLLAAGIFSFLQEKIMPEIPLNICDDFSPHSINMIINMCMGKALEMVYHQAYAQKSNHTLLSKLANQIAVFFATTKKEALLLGAPTQQHTQTFTLCELMYLAVAHFQIVLNDQPAVSKKSMGYGVLISRLRLSLVYCQEAVALYKNTPQALSVDLMGLLASISELHKELENDNALVYMEEVPNSNTLPPLESICPLTKTTVKWEDITESIDSVISVFSYLLPASVQQKLEQFRATSRSLVSYSKDTVSLLERQAVEFESPTPSISPSSLLDSLWIAISEYQNKGGLGISGVPRIDANIHHLEELSSQCHQIIADVKIFLSSSSSSPPNVYGNSNDFSDSTKHFLNQLSSYESKIYEADFANKKLRATYDAHARFVNILTGTKEDLQRSAHSIGVHTEPSLAYTKAMEALMETLRTVKEAAQTLETDASKEEEQLIASLVDTRNENVEFMCDEAIHRITNKDKEIKEKIEAFHIAFASAKGVAAGDGAGPNSLENFRKEVLNSISTFETLQQQLSQGFVFFTQMTNLGKNLQQQIKNVN